MLYRNLFHLKSDALKLDRMKWILSFPNENFCLEVTKQILIIANIYQEAILNLVG